MTIKTLSFLCCLLALVQACSNEESNRRTQTENSDAQTASLNEGCDPLAVPSSCGPTRTCVVTNGANNTWTSKCEITTESTACSSRRLVCGSGCCFAPRQACFSAPGGRYACANAPSPAPTPTPVPYMTQCTKAGVNVPQELPNQKTCLPDSQVGCNYWQPLGPKIEGLNRVDQNYIFQTKDTLCFYTYRVMAAVNKIDHPVQCFNINTCNACAFGGNEAPADATKLSQLPGGNDAGECQSCHYSGPILPRAPIWDAVNSSSSKTVINNLNVLCAGNGGPNYVGTTWAAPKPANRVTAPSDCSSCHYKGFVRSEGACDIIAIAFEKNGSMVGNNFSSAQECQKFLKAMGCVGNEIPCPTPTPTPKLTTAPTNPPFTPSSKPTITPVPTVTPKPTFTPTSSPKPTVSPSATPVSPKTPTPWVSPTPMRS